MPTAETRNSESFGAVGRYLRKRFPMFTDQAWLFGNFSHEILRETIYALMFDCQATNFPKSTLTFRFKNYLRLALVPFEAQFRQASRDNFEHRVNAMAVHCVESAKAVGMLLDFGDNQWTVGPRAVARLSDTSLLIIDPTPTEILSDELGVNALSHGQVRIITSAPEKLLRSFETIECVEDWIVNDPWTLRHIPGTDDRRDLFSIPSAEVEILHVVDGKAIWIPGDRIKTIWQDLWKEVALARTPFSPESQMARQFYIGNALQDFDNLAVRPMTRNCAVRLRYQICKRITGNSGIRISQAQGSLYVSPPTELPFPESFMMSIGLAHHVFGDATWPEYRFHESFGKILNLYV